MSHQTGIKASEELTRFFAQSRSGNVRLIKVIIKDEELALGRQEAAAADWEADFARSLPHCLDASQPCYVLFRLDSRSSHGAEWLLVSFAADHAPVRQKMLLAATRATLKAHFGLAHIRHELHATTKEEVTVDEFKRYLAAKATPGPMTDVESELFAARHEEAAARGQARTLAAQTLRGVAFPVDADAEDCLRQLRHGHITFVQLSVDTLNEAIKLELADSIGANQLSAKIPRDKPRYNFFRFPHTHEGDSFDTVVFIYSMPSNGCSIKERMLYSSCKAPFLDTVASFLDLTPDRKLEMDSADSLDEAALLDWVHPKVQLNQPLFAKPDGPPNRGLRRIINPVAD